MRRLVATSIALGLAATLAACGKSSNQDQGAQTTEAVATAPSPEELKKIQASLPAPYNTADLTNGAASFALCASCHTITSGGPNLTGPHLHDVVGRKVGSVANYNYSEPMKTAGFTWDAARLDSWLTNPRVMMPATKMSFIGMKNPKDRADLIAYLMVNSAAKPQ
ncbi:cytochrome c family protein [Phenylobacterium sp. LjRoot225]|uniref:c-type cytochrome n=1 Tax=Phenylobacterium sp. LjRoot225 TaxID=3342285 RepID=UPI003ECF2576